MKCNAIRLQKSILAVSYIYLALPVVLFFTGWCHWQFGIPLAAAVVCAVGLCLREHVRTDSPFLDTDTAVYHAGYRQWGKILLILGFVLAWTWLSGVGGYAWQNTDHPIRNQIFQLLMEETWPVVKEPDAAAGPRALIYYLGYWLPAAGIGKLCGPKAGWAAQYVWAVTGILLMYALLCLYRKKLSVWPLLVIIWFSGPDAAGMLLRSPEKFRILDTLSLDEWFGYYQFSSMTTQLFWVFNQAVPAWVLCMLVFLGEKPKNLVFVSSLAVLTSTFPFAGLVPFVLYFMVIRCVYKQTDVSKGGRQFICGKSRITGGRQFLTAEAGICLRDSVSLQNLAGTAVAAASLLYLAGNGSVEGSFPAIRSGKVMILLSGLGAAILTGIALAAGSGRIKRAAAHPYGMIKQAAAHLYRMIKQTAAHPYRKIDRAARPYGKYVWKLSAAALGILAVAVRICQISGQLHPLRYFLYLVIFYTLEAGVLLAALYPSAENKKLFALTAVWLFVIPLILIGNSSDFCMRASIPGLFLLMLWCIRALEKLPQRLRNKEERRQRISVCLLAALLALGVLTPLHEMTRTVVNMQHGIENQTASLESVLRGNNFSGTTEGFFWKYVAKN